MAQTLKNSVLDWYRYREVLFNLLSQDLKVRYKRTFLGYFWSLLNPVLQLSLLSVVFSHVVGREMRDYPLYLFSGLIAWWFFQNSLVSSASALLDHESFIKKVYLPKAIFPLSKLCLRSVDFAFSVVALGIIAVGLGYRFPLSALALPLAALLLFAFTFGLSLALSVITVYFRDVQHLLNVFLQMLYFATPILYPLSAFPEKYQFWFHLNPFYSQVIIFQKLIYVGQLPTMTEWGIAAGTSALALTAGLGVLLSLEDDLVFRM